MVSLIDVAPPEAVRASVPVAGKQLPVKGLSLHEIAALLYRFPELRALIAGQPARMTVERMLELFPDAVCAAIAAACGGGGDEAYEAAARRLVAGDQVAVLEAVLALTIPSGEGLAPFIERVVGLLDGPAASASGGKAPATSSRSRPKP